MRVAIVEDETGIRAELDAFVNRYAKEHSIKIDTVLFSDGDEIVEDYRQVYDVILFDIHMRRMDGLKAAEKIRELDEEVIIIFITNMANFAIKGYSVDAFDFIVKLVSYFALSQKLQKAFLRLAKRAASYIGINAESGLIRQNVAKIYYVESYQSA